MSASDSVVSSEREIYRRAPLIEAAVDIRCTNRSTFTMADVALFAEQFSGEFRQYGEAIETTEEYRADGAKRITERPIGVVLRRQPDERAVLQVQTTGFTYSQTSPYDRWETFRDEVIRLWRAYRNVAEPESVNRVEVRYINRLDIGDVIDELPPFINVYPVTPWQLKSPPAGFSLQIRMPRPEGDALVVNVATVRTGAAGQIALLLDLDAFHAGPLDADDVWNVVERLHVTVEDAFESAITDRVRELIR